MPDQAKDGMAWTIEGAPVIFGILNITEDSFSDGGRYLKTSAAIAHADRLLDSGAHIVDVGPAASSVGSMPVGAEEEIRRLEPVITALQKRGACISVDSCLPETQSYAMRRGVGYLNDISFDLGHLVTEALPVWIKCGVDPQPWLMPLETTDDGFAGVWIRPPAQVAGRVALDDQDLRQASRDDSFSDRKFVTWRDIDRPDMRDGGGQDRPRERAGLPASERKSHDVRNVERVRGGHDGPHSQSICLDLSFPPGDQLDRDSHAPLSRPSAAMTREVRRSRSLVGNCRAG